MCEANVYMFNDENNEEELLLEKVDRIVPQGQELLLEDIFGKRRIVKARIKEMTLVDHRVVLEKL